MRWSTNLRWRAEPRASTKAQHAHQAAAAGDLDDYLEEYLEPEVEVEPEELVEIAPSDLVHGSVAHGSVAHGSNGRSRFELSALTELARDADARSDRAADAAFAELFEEATRQSSLPIPNLPPEPPLEEDTEIFDSAAFARAEQIEDEPIEDAFTAEELDSSEFDVLVDTSVDTSVARHVSSSSSSSTPPRPSQAPEKRPSFLGRLFGRKAEE